MHRAYSVIDLKAVDAEKRILTGLATSPMPDRMGDVVEPDGAKYALPIPLLWQHDSRQPIGEVYAAKASGKGIEISARIAKIDEPGALKDRVDMAWQSIKAGLVRGLSIGFRSLKEAYDKENNGYIYLEWEWLELSAVTIPANELATIQTLKSYDVDRPVAPDTRTFDDLKPAGAAAPSRPVKMGAPKATAMKTYGEQIKTWEATRKAKTDRQDAIQKAALERGEAKSDAEREEFSTLTGEIAACDSELKDLAALEAREAEQAEPVVEQKGLQMRPGAHVTIERKLPPGILFARYAMCVGASHGVPVEAMRLAKSHYPDDPGVLALIEKTAVAGGATTGSHYLDDMVPYNVMNDFIEYLRPGSIIGKFGGPNPGGGPNYPSLNRVGFNERVSGMSTGFTSAWTGEGLPALPSAAVTFNASLLFTKLCALAILTKEAIRFSNPAAEGRVRDDLARAINYRMDYDFVDPANAGTAALKPAAITNAIVATAPTGTGATNVRKDIATMLGSFASNNLDPGDIVLIMSASMANQISMMVNTLGNDDFPTLTMKGGQLRGFPVIVSETLTSVGSPSTQTIIAVKASDVYLADDGVVTVEASDQASLEMVDTSSASAISGTGASLVSLWQTGAVGIMARREVNWKLRRSTAVQYISPAAYVAA